jgi:small subunit ribosomal protein S16
MDSRNKRDGAAIEELGWFNPVDQNKTYSLDDERIIHWLKAGAQPSDALHGLMKRSGLAHKWHLIGQGLDEKEIEKEMKKWAADRQETLKRRAEKTLEKAKQAKLKKSEKEETPAEEVPVEETPAEEEAPAEEETPAEEEAKEKDDSK